MRAGGRGSGHWRSGCLAVVIHRLALVFRIAYACNVLDRNEQVVRAGAWLASAHGAVYVHGASRRDDGGRDRGAAYLTASALLQDYRSVHCNLGIACVL
jgi:hypothetical protein